MPQQIRTNVLYTLKNIEFCASNEQINSICSLMNEDGSFTDLQYQADTPNAWSWCTHIARLSDLATNDKWLANEEHRAKIVRSLEYFSAEHRKCCNWWYNEVGLPLYCGRLYLCFEEYLNQEQKDLLRNYVEQGSIALHPAFLNVRFGANLLWGTSITLYHALIDQDLSLMSSALTATTKELSFQNGGEGIQNDFSFFQHQTQFYNGGYGRSFLYDFAYLIYALKETEYQFAPEHLSFLAGFMIYGTRFCIRNRHYDYLTTGREISRPDALSADSVRKALLLLLQVPEMPCRDVMQEQLASMSTEGYAVKGHRLFTESNYYSAKSVTYHIGCHGTSHARSMGESINGENMLSANLYAGGATCIMVDGKEYENIFPLWDFAHIPGTTAPEESDEELSTKVPLWHGKTADNTYCKGICHNDHGILFQDVNFNGITGVISRFFIDGVMIALGAGLTGESNHNITSTLNQCHQYDETVLTSQDGLPENAVYQGRIAYASLDEQPILVNSAVKEGAWSRINQEYHRDEKSTVCTFYIDHGKQPKDASYAYVVIPAVSANGAAERIQEITQKITVLQNDKGVQAIRYGEKILCAFHKNDTLDIALYDKVTGSARTTYIA